MIVKIKTIVLAIFITFITLLIILFPEQSLYASIRGLKTWWEIVFPSLLPFFIVVELLISFGIVQFFGVLFEPVMRPLFNVPGVGSFAWIIGMVSGFPTGAKITTMLRERNEVSKTEAERLISFSNASSPLFIFGAIAVGFFHQVELGIIIAMSHYTSNFIVGIMMRYYKREQEIYSEHKKRRFFPPLKRAFERMHETRIKEKRPFGEILGDAVLSSIQTLLIVGGFIILFSVFTTLLSLIKVTDLIVLLATPLFALFNLSTDFIHPLITGVFEITMGADAVSKTNTIPILWQLVLVSFILGFNGFSIQAQVASIIAKTDIHFRPYFIARVMHATIASVITFTSYKLYFHDHIQVSDMFDLELNGEAFLLAWIRELQWLGPLITISSIAIGMFILLTKIMQQRS